jgi:hypothetical protein
MNQAITVLFAIVFFSLVVYPIGWYLVEAIQDGLRAFHEWRGRTL